jgi:hypothetical protein
MRRGRAQVHENALRLPDLCFGVGIGIAVGIGIGFDPDSDPDRLDMGGIFGIEGAEDEENTQSTR